MEEAKGEGLGCANCGHLRDLIVMNYFSLPELTSNAKATLNQNRLPPPMPQSITHFHSGFFSINDRLYPERTKNPFAFRDDLEDERSEFEEGPVRYADIH